MLKSKMDIAFWSIAAIDAILFTVILSLDSSRSSGQSDNGAMFLFFIVPSVLIGLAILMYYFCRSTALRSIALVIVTGPGLVIMYRLTSEVYINYELDQERKGQVYFSGTAMNALAAAVVRGDVPAMMKIGPEVAVDMVGDREGWDGMTLLALTVHRALAQQHAAAQPTAQPPITYLPVVQALIDLGAKPGVGLHDAILLKDPAILTVLLKAGGDPNQANGNGLLAAHAVENGSAENFRLLAANGLNVNLVERGDPLSVKAAIYKRWEKLAILIAHGADFKKPRYGDGRNVAGEVTDAIAQVKAKGGEPEPALLRVQALINR